jgi:dTMP kinase
MKKIKNGLLISIEGIDGSGKSSLAKALTIKLQDAAYDVFFTKEPGGTDLGKKIREILMTKNDPVTPIAEFLLFAADRSQHFAEKVIPALSEGSIVISDRMADSSLVYQGYGRGINKEMIKTVNSWAMQDRKPDIVLYLRLSTEQAYERIAQRNEPLTSFEKEKEFIKTLEEAFETVFKDRPDVVTLDAIKGTDTLLDYVFNTIVKKIDE